MSGEQRVHDEKISFDYMHFLSVSCKKQWGFIDAIYGIMPIFGMVLKPLAENNPQKKLNALALQVLSTQVSDETNIIRLINLAEQQRMPALDIQLPYPLETKQLSVIKQQCPTHISFRQNGECLSVQLLPVTSGQQETTHLPV